MTSFAIPSGRPVTFQASTCFRIGSKFRCMRSTPTDRMSTRLRCLVCLASTGVNTPPMAKMMGDEQLGSNANVANGGIRKGARSDEIRPIIRPRPLRPLRPKRAASGVAGLRYGSGQRKTNHALMSETSAGEPQPEAIPLNIYVRQVRHEFFSFFSCPIFLRHPEARGRCSQSEWILYGRDLCLFGRNRETR